MKLIFSILFAIAATQAHADGVVLWGDKQPAPQQQPRQDVQQSAAGFIAGMVAKPKREDAPKPQPETVCTPSLWSDCKDAPSR